MASSCSKTPPVGPSESWSMHLMSPINGPPGSRRDDRVSEHREQLSCRTLKPCFAVEERSAVRFQTGYMHMHAVERLVVDNNAGVLTLISVGATT